VEVGQVKPRDRTLQESLIMKTRLCKYCRMPLEQHEEGRCALCVKLHYSKREDIKTSQKW
jgi:hypothetical protein